MIKFPIVIKLSEPVEQVATDGSVIQRRDVLTICRAPRFGDLKKIARLSSAEASGKLIELVSDFDGALLDLLSVRDFLAVQEALGPFLGDGETPKEG